MDAFGFYQNGDNDTCRCLCSFEIPCGACAAKWSGETVQPKSRLMIPRHMDPQIGTYRTDALNNSWPAMEVAVTIAVSFAHGR